jgi:hypothetical protein
MFRGQRSIATESGDLIYGFEIARLWAEIRSHVGILSRLRVFHNLVLTEVAGSGQRDFRRAVLQSIRIGQDSLGIHLSRLSSQRRRGRRETKTQRESNLGDGIET